MWPLRIFFKQKHSCSDAAKRKVITDRILSPSPSPLRQLSKLVSFKRSEEKSEKLLFKFAIILLQATVHVTLSSEVTNVAPFRKCCPLFYGHLAGNSLLVRCHVTMNQPMNAHIVLRNNPATHCI